MSPIVLSTGSYQGCSISQKLHSLFTADCISTVDSTSVVKDTDYTTVSGMVSRINDEDEHSH